MNKCKIYKPDQYELKNIGIEESECYYFPELMVGSTNVAVRAARIEVKDIDSPIHKHPGATISYIVSGSGFLKTEDGNKPIKAGDVVYIPSMEIHTFVADKNIIMVTQMIYMSEKGDIQDYIPA